jgi:molybdate transport system substrate-binding protein
VTEAKEQPTIIMSALAVLAVVEEIVLPKFGSGGSTAKLVWDPTVALMKRIADGEKADGIVAIDWALDELTEKRMIDPASRRPVAQAAVGVAVKAGAPKPDISTAEALTKTLLGVPSLVYSRAGASGIFFEKLIDRLGIGEAIRAKALVIPRGLTGERVASGEVELAIQQVSELMVVEGIDLVGPMPDEVQATTNFGAAVFADAADPGGAARFIDALLTPEAREACSRTGLVPLF